MLLTCNTAVPLLVRVTVCAALAFPIGKLVKLSDAGDSSTLAAAPVPVRLTCCCEPAALSFNTTEPVRLPPAVGVNVIEIVQLPAAGTLLPQSLVWLKSPVEVIEVIASDALPMLRSNTVCGELLEPTCTVPNCSAAGLKETPAAAAEEILAIIVSTPPPVAVWNAPGVVGKSDEFDQPPT